MSKKLFPNLNCNHFESSWFGLFLQSSVSLHMQNSKCPDSLSFFAINLALFTILVLHYIITISSNCQIIIASTWISSIPTSSSGLGRGSLQSSDQPRIRRRSDPMTEARSDCDLATEERGDSERPRIVEVALPADFDRSTHSSRRVFSRSPPRWLPPTLRRPPSVSLGSLRSRSLPRRGIGPMYLSVVVRS